MIIFLSYSLHTQFDEVVPTHLETKHRGFYINSGELDFETVAAEEEEEEEEEQVSTEEESLQSEEEVKKKKKVVGNKDFRNIFITKCIEI